MAERVTNGYRRTGVFAALDFQEQIVRLDLVRANHRLVFMEAVALAAMS